MLPIYLTAALLLTILLVLRFTVLASYAVSHPWVQNGYGLVLAGVILASGIGYTIVARYEKNH
jgi:pilus assembly protein TadC